MDQLAADAFPLSLTVKISPFFFFIKVMRPANHEHAGQHS